MKIKHLSEMVSAFFVLGKTYTCQIHVAMRYNNYPSVLLAKERLAMLEKASTTDADRRNIAKMNDELRELIEVWNDFNELFSAMGWIVYDSLDMQIVRKAVRVAKSQSMLKAENILIDYYDSRIVELGIARLWGVECFRGRLHLIKLAYDDYLSGRYHACIPVLIMMIDGVVADADSSRNMSFFSDKSNVTAWDSIAGHEMGLKVIKEIFYKERKTTEKNKITLPFRNGIMHGRDLGYANREVAAKCWALLFAVRDMLADKKSEVANKTKFEVDRAKTVADIQKEMQQMEADLAEVNAMDSFKRLPIVLGGDVPITGKSEIYELNSPERSLVRFFEYWMQFNYGSMADATYLPTYLTKTKMAGRLRQIFSNKSLVSFRFSDIHDQSSCICDVTTTISIQYKEYTSDYSLTFRLLRCKENSPDLAVNPAKAGRWKVVENFSAINEIGSIIEYLPQ